MDVGTPLARLIRWLVHIDDSASHSGRAEQFLEKPRMLSCDFSIAELATSRCLMCERVKDLRTY